MDSFTQLRILTAKFFKLRLKFQVLFLVNFCLCGIARAAINLFSLKRISPYFGDFYKTVTISTMISQQQMHDAFQIGRMVRLAAKYTPWDSSCLTQAMVAKFWCRLFKIPYVLYIGFAKDSDEPSGYKAHAWITAGRVAITGGNGFIDYKVISSYVYFSG